MIEVNQVSKKIKATEILKDISLTIGTGEKFVLLGKSGSGKSTLMKMINKLLLPDAGNIILNGNDLNTCKTVEVRKNMGYVIQGIGLFPHMTISDNIAVVPNLLKWDKQKIKLRIEELIEKLRLDINLLNRFPRELSGGQQQRVGVARAMAANPSILLMDEPFGALDQPTRKQIRNELKNMDEFKTKTLLLVTHDIEEAVELGESICFIEQGRIEAQFSLDALLFERSAEGIRTKYLQDQVLSMQMKKTKLSSLIPFIPDCNEDAEELPVSAQDNVSHVLERMLFNESSAKKIIFKEHPTISFTANRLDILSAFYAKVNSYN